MKIVSVSCLLLALTLSLDCGATRGAETNDVPRVGPLREFNRFTFEGNTSFSAWSLWLGLNSTFNFPEQSHPLAPRDEFLAAIGSQLRLGYQHCGFPDAQVTARYDSKGDRVVVQVREEARYLCGPVEVIGAQKMPTQPIVTALTTTNAVTAVQAQPFQFLDNAPANRVSPTDTDDSTNQNFLWITDQPARFDDLSLRKLAGLVTNTLNQHGFYLSRLNLKVVPNARTRTATLQVRILDEGPPATVNRIRVVGNRRNSRKEILNYLDLKSGIKFTSDLAAAINDRLYHSARFLTNSVTIGVPDSAGRLTLTINVAENDQCPPLNGAFTPTEQTMLKARDWLAKVGQTREDVVLTFSGYPDEASAIKFILSPRRGLLVLENEETSGTNRLCHALILSSNQVALYAPERRQKFLAHQTADQLQNWVAVETRAPAEDGNCASLAVGAGMENLNGSTNAPPCAFRISLAPAAFVRLAHTTNSVCWFDGDELICSNADSVLKLDARTGRFIELTARSEEPHHAQLSLCFQPDAFVPAFERVEQDGAGFENVYDTNSPLGSAVSFFGSELAESKFAQPFLRARLPAVTCAQLPALLRKLGRGNFFSSFKSLKDFETPPDGPAGKFQIPEEPRPTAGGTLNDWLATAAQGMFQGGDIVLPVRSWPWTVARDVAFLSREQKKYVLQDLAGIYDSRETGPLGCLVTATLLKSMNAPAAKAMADRGLERLKADDFKRDCRLFLDENTFCGRFVIGLAGVLGNLNQQELDALVAPMSPGAADFIRDCARRLRAAGKDQPLFETIAPALDAWWEKALKQQMADDLSQIANE